MKRTLVLLRASTLACVAGCVPATGIRAPTGDEAAWYVSWKFENLPPLSVGWRYELWHATVEDDAPLALQYPVTEVAVDENGVASGEVPNVGPDATTSVRDESAGHALVVVATGQAVASILLAGKYYEVDDGVNGESEATMLMADPAAVAADLSLSRHEYHLATYTTPDLTDDWSSGIWWSPGSETAGAAAVLPALCPGWSFEGWVVADGVPVSTGRFFDASLPDSDGAGAGAGPATPPAFAGQEFISPHQDLIGLEAWISIEPDPDDAAGPFLPVLVDVQIDAVQGALALDPTAPLPAGQTELHAVLY